jgi:hypothetical protein
MNEERIGNIENGKEIAFILITLGNVIATLTYALFA